MGGILVAYLWLLGCLVVYCGYLCWESGDGSIYGAVMELFVEQRAMRRVLCTSLSISSRLARLDWQG